MCKFFYKTENYVTLDKQVRQTRTNVAWTRNCTA